MQTSRRSQLLLWALTAYIAFIFVQSLFFKFSDSPETIYIFGKLETWAAGLGAPGLFAPGGIFSAYVVGSAELVASLLLVGGLASGRALIHALGALMALGVISGAIFFHLFTPLGIEALNADGSYDGGELFYFACGVWLASAVLIGLRKSDLLDFWKSRYA